MNQCKYCDEKGLDISDWKRSGDEGSNQWTELSTFSGFYKREAATFISSSNLSSPNKNEEVITNPWMRRFILHVQDNRSCIWCNLNNEHSKDVNVRSKMSNHEAIGAAHIELEFRTFGFNWNTLACGPQKNYINLSSRNVLKSLLTSKDSIAGSSTIKRSWKTERRSDRTR